MSDLRFSSLFGRVGSVAPRGAAVDRTDLTDAELEGQQAAERPERVLVTGVSILGIPLALIDGPDRLVASKAPA